MIANISLGAYPVGLAVAPKGDAVFVAACRQLALSCVGPELLLVHGASHLLRYATFDAFNGLSSDLAVDPATDTVYALGGGSNLTLVGIDGGTGALRSASDIGSSCAGAGGGNIAVDGSSGVVYAAFASQRYLLLIDGSTGRIVDMVNATGGIQSVAFDPGTNGAYVDMEAQGQGAGYLLALPAVPGQTYVNTGLLPQGVCVP